MAKKKKRKKSQLEYKPLEWYYFIPILFIIGIIPLITFGKVIALSEIEVVNWKGGETGIDFFSYYKYNFFTVFVLISTVLIIFLRLTNQFKLKISRYYISLSIYIVGVLLSYLLSDYPDVALRGFIEQFQGVWVMIGYALIIFVIYNMVDEENQVKTILYGFVFSATVVGLIGVGQYFGADLFKSEFGKLLILPQNLHHIAETLKFTFSEHTIYSTLYNTNYVGSFTALILPVAIFMFLYSREKKKMILSFIFTVLMMMTWIGSNSRAGYVGFFFGLIFLIIFYRKKIKKDIKKFGALLAAFLAIVVIMNTASDGGVLNQFSRLNPIEESGNEEETESKNVRWEDIKFEENSVSVVTNYETLKVELDDSQLKFYDENNENLKVKVENSRRITFEGEKYKDYRVLMDSDNSRFIINSYGRDLPIYFINDELNMMGTSGVLRRTEYPPKLDMFDGREKFASSRGYIWSRSIPMLKDTILIGHGPDTYPIEFPQYDYVGKLNSFSNHRMIVDKPHNMYLQIGINTGLVSLLALLALYVMYFIDTIKIYFKREINTFLEYIGLGAFVGIMAYMAAGMFNDQIISVAPLFYAMTGLGLAVNRLVKKQEA